MSRNAARFGGTDVTVLIGAAPYPLTAEQAVWLAETIRKLCTDEGGDPLDAAPYAATRFAEELESRIAGESAEPIDLGHTAREGMLAYALADFLVAGEPALERLYTAARRARNDP